jgi:hypothetical protein
MLYVNVRHCPQVFLFCCSSWVGLAWVLVDTIVRMEGGVVLLATLMFLLCRSLSLTHMIGSYVVYFYIYTRTFSFFCILTCLLTLDFGTTAYVGSDRLYWRFLVVVRFNVVLSSVKII